MKAQFGILAGMIVLGAFAPASRATPIAYDGFESYATSSGLNGGSAGTNSTGPNGEFGWTSDWTAISGVNVTNASLLGGGTKTAEVDDDTNNIVSATRSFTAQTGTVYFSLLFNAAAGLDGTDFLHFYLSNSNSSNNNSGGIGDIDTSKNVFGARVGGGNGGSTNNSTITFTQGTTYLLVGKLSKVSSTNYNQIDLFVNPTTSTEPGTADATQTGDSTISQVSDFSLRTFNLDAGDQYQFDEVRIGTSFADVVPEPASLGLLGLGALGLLARRRS